MFFTPGKPLRLSFDLDRRVEQMFNELIHKPWGRTEESKGWQPAIDLHETETAYVLEADLPGVLPEHIELRVNENSVLLRGRRESVQVSRTACSVCVERAHGEFQREFAMRHAIDAANVQTQFENGIFRAHLPKLASRQRRESSV